MKDGDLTGAVLDGRYRVGERVGRGAMGNVYRGERLKLGRVVAIKVMQDGTVSDAFRKRFEREAMAMAKLEHPHCGSVLDVGTHENNPYVVMEFVDGKNLKELIEAGPLPTHRAVDITRQVLSGLSHAHEHGVIHRDIKPANIVVSQKAGLGDQVKILDFGLARFHEEASNLTAGVVVGTPNYMAPEQIAGKPVDQRADLYACGVLLFELLTGQKPFTAAEPVAVCLKHLNDAPPPLSAVAAGKSFGALQDVVARALEKDPAHRFASAHEFSQALIDAATQRGEARKPVAAEATVALKPGLAESSTVMALPPPARATGKRTRTVAVIGAAVVALGLGAVAFVATRSDAEPPTHPTPAAAPVAVETASAPAATDPVADLVSHATDLASGGQREAAIDSLVKARKTYPDDARLPYTLAKLYLEKMWWADGLKQARAALALDPKLKTDPDLIKLVLRGFNTTASYDWTLAHFLHDDIGDAAKPYLEEAATNHPNPIVRARAKRELRRYK